MMNFGSITMLAFILIVCGATAAVAGVSADFSPGEDAKRNHRMDNELHSTGGLHFNHLDEDADGEEDSEMEDGSYYDDPDSNNPDSLGEDDAEYIAREEHQHEGHDAEDAKPRVGKCCKPSEGLDIKGSCEPVNPQHYHGHETSWFPDQVWDFDGTPNAMVASNISAWDIVTNFSFECIPGESVELVTDMSHFVFLKDGRLYLVQHSKILDSMQFCVDQQLGRGGGRAIRACFSRQELCGNKNCLRKCCPEGAVVEEPLSRCSRHHSLAHNFTGNWSIIHATPKCNYGEHITELEFGFKITENGSLETPEVNVSFLGYCMDYFVNMKDENRTPILKALHCLERERPDISIVPPAVAFTFGIALIISALCLLFAAVISWRLPELRSLHGKCQLSHLGTLFCLFLMLAVVQIGGHHLYAGACHFFAVAIHTCALSSFLWLNLLCVNIYLTFRSLRPPLAARRDENRRLFFLCVYAWGIPLAFCVFLYILDSQPGRLDPMPRPEYGVLKCGISNRGGEFAYLFGPIGVLLFLNGILFCLTAQELLCGLWRLDNSDSINFRRKSMGIVVAKLGVVMGMGWILDVVSWLVGPDYSYLFYAADFFNSLQGVFICLVLIWRKRVLEVLHLRKPSITKDETLTARPFLPKHDVNNTSQADNDTSLVLVPES